MGNMDIENTQGFRFCGQRISGIGLQYIPKKEDIFVWDNEYKTQDLSVGGHDGGYWFGTTLEPKIFKLDCFFEEITLLNVQKIQSLFSRGKTGELIFDERPYLKYTATVTKTSKPVMYGKKTGLLTLELTAYYPFAKMDIKSTINYLDFGLENKEGLKANTGILSYTMTPSSIFTEPVVDETRFLLYNAGDERADVTINIAGNIGDGVLICNSGTKQSCIVKGLTKNNTTNLGKWLGLEASTGKVYMTDGQTSQMSFLYHDRGFIQLLGSCPVDREKEISFNADTITSNGLFPPDIEGKFVRINDEWIKVTKYITPSMASISKPLSGSGTVLTDIVTMNEIVIQPLNNTQSLDITKLEFLYDPTFR